MTKVRISQKCLDQGLTEIAKSVAEDTYLNDQFEHLKNVMIDAHQKMFCKPDIPTSKFTNPNYKHSKTSDESPQRSDQDRQEVDNKLLSSFNISLVFLNTLGLLFRKSSKQRIKP